ncbi:MAG: thiamine phosphate synthase [Actinomycetota bacterium]
MLRHRLGLYVITYADTSAGGGHLDVAAAALEGGADAIQLRAKELGGREMHELASRICAMARQRGDCIFFVNDRVDVAMASGADGVHLGQEDLELEAARSLVGEDMIVGISATTVEEAKRAEAGGADYLGVGPVFATPSKPDAVLPMGLEGLEEIRGAVALPIVAIGGVSEANARQVFDAGADGIAVISAVTGTADMAGAVRALRRLVDGCLRGR